MHLQRRRWTAVLDCRPRGCRQRPPQKGRNPILRLQVCLQLCLAPARRQRLRRKGQSVEGTAFKFLPPRDRELHSRLGAEHLNSRHGPLKSVLRHTFTCDRKLLASWQVVSSWKAKDAAEQKIISGEDGSRRASHAGAFVLRTGRYGGPTRLAARGKVWNVHPLGTVLCGWRGSILADHGTHGRNLRGGVSRVPARFNPVRFDPQAWIDLARK